MKTNVIFDWSGTLLNNFDQIYSITMNIFKKLGGKKISKEKYKNENVSPYMKFWNHYFPNLTKEEQDSLFSLYLETSETPKIYPGVKKILQDLQKNDFKLFLLSSQPQNNLVKQMKQLGVYDYFTLVIGDVHDKKIAFSDLINRNNLSIDDTICIGDTIGEIEAGKVSKITTVGLTWGFNSEAQLDSANPDYIIGNLHKLFEILCK